MNPRDFTPVDLAQRAAGGDLAPEVVVWLQTAFSRWLAGEPLEHAMQLDRASRLRARNAALLDAADILAADRCEPWALACRLAAAISRYESRIAPLVLRDPSLSLGPVDTALRRAFATGVRIPTTARRIYDLIA